jgi:IstB-like ATP binding protein
MTPNGSGKLKANRKIPDHEPTQRRPAQLCIGPAAVLGDSRVANRRQQSINPDLSSRMMEVLFTLLAQRYERSSLLLSSNLPFSKREGIFKDPMTKAAAIDRLVHHCVILELNIASYRMEEAKKNRDAGLKSGGAN